MSVTKLPDPLPKVHQCGCGSQAFHLCADGRVACLQCRYIIEPLTVVDRRPNPETQAAESKVAKVLRESIERVRPTVLAEREGETITGEVMNMILKGSECPCCYGKGRIPEEAPNATVAYLIGLTRSPVESVPVAVLEKLIDELRADSHYHPELGDRINDRSIARQECADRLSAIVKENSK